MKTYIEQLDKNGYCILPGVFSADEMNRALELVIEWEKKAPQASNVPYLNRNQLSVYNLQNKDPYFLQLLFKSTEIESLLKHYLNDAWYKPIPADEPNYILRGFTARSSNVSMPLHIDSHIPYLGSHVFSIQFSIILEDQDESNGCTVVVPGSHLSGEYATQEALRDAIPICSRTGDVVMWDSRLWHAALENNSGRTRWAMIATFARWWLKQSFNFTGSLPAYIFNELTDSQKAILGYCSIPFRDESEGIDMKTGYDMLPHRAASATNRP